MVSARSSKTRVRRSGSDGEGAVRDSGHGGNEPDSQDFRDAVLGSDVLVQEITAAVRKLLASTA